MFKRSSAALFSGALTTALILGMAAPNPAFAKLEESRFEYGIPWELAMSTKKTLGLENSGSPIRLDLQKLNAEASVIKGKFDALMQAAFGDAAEVKADHPTHLAIYDVVKGDEEQPNPPYMKSFVDSKEGLKSYMHDKGLEIDDFEAHILYSLISDGIAGPANNRHRQSTLTEINTTEWNDKFASYLNGSNSLYKQVYFAQYYSEAYNQAVKEALGDRLKGLSFDFDVEKIDAAKEGESLSIGKTYNQSSTGIKFIIKEGSFADQTAEAAGKAQLARVNFDAQSLQFDPFVSDYLQKVKEGSIPLADLSNTISIDGNQSTYQIFDYLSHRYQISTINYAGRIRGYENFTDGVWFGPIEGITPTRALVTIYEDETSTGVYGDIDSELTTVESLADTIPFSGGTNLLGTKGPNLARVTHDEQGTISSVSLPLINVLNSQNILHATGTNGASGMNISVSQTGDNNSYGDISLARLRQLFYTGDNIPLVNAAHTSNDSNTVEISRFKLKERPSEKYFATGAPIAVDGSDFILDVSNYGIFAFKSAKEADDFYSKLAGFNPEDIEATTSILSLEIAHGAEAENDAKTGELIIEKKLDGIDSDQSFDFKLKLEAQPSISYKVTHISTDGTETELEKVETGTDYHFKLKSGEKLKVEGLPFDAKYTVEEAESKELPLKQLTVDGIDIDPKSKSTGELVLTDNDGKKLDYELVDTVTFVNAKGEVYKKEEPKKPLPKTSDLGISGGTLSSITAALSLIGLSRIIKKA